MKRALSIVLGIALLLVSMAAFTPAHATGTTQVLIGSTGNNVLSTTVFNAFPLADKGNPTTSDTGANMRGMATVGGTISSLYAAVTAAPGAGKSYVFTVDDSGVGTALTCTISGASQTSCSDTSDAPAVAQGDNLSIGVTPSGTPAAVDASASTIFTPTVSNQTIIPLGGTTSTTANSSAFAQFDAWDNGFLFSTIVPEASSTTLFPEGGTISNLMIHQQTAPGAGTSNAWTFRNNSSNTVATCSVANTGKTCNDLSDTVAVSTSDLFDLAYVNTGSTAASRVQAGVTFAPNTSGDYIFIASTHSAADLAGASEVIPISGNGIALNTAEANFRQVSNAQTMTKLQVQLDVAPGTGKNKVFTLRDNGANTSLTCTIADSATSCSMTGSVTIAAGDLLNTLEVTSSGAITTNFMVSYIGTQVQATPIQHASVYVGLSNFFVGKSSVTIN